MTPKAKSKPNQSLRFDYFLATSGFGLVQFSVSGLVLEIPTPAYGTNWIESSSQGLVGSRKLHLSLLHQLDRNLCSIGSLELHPSASFLGG